jgi:protein-L-isoaspartate(D-aspartate) O-methyltransferase
MTDQYLEQRRRYAEEIAVVGGIRSAALLRAFGVLRREDFLPPPPWIVEDIDGTYYLAEDTSLSWILHAVGVCLDIKRRLNSANPALIARFLEATDVQPGETVFHVGAGFGYYSAILAELAGKSGRVIASEIDPHLQAHARRNLAAFETVEVVGDALTFELPPVDVIFVSAGMSELPSAWTDALRTGGRLLVPLTGTLESGHVFLFRKTADAAWFEARRLKFNRFYSCVGSRHSAEMEAIDQMVAAPGLQAIKWLRLDAHDQDANCWLHRKNWCICLQK